MKPLETIGAIPVVCSPHVYTEYSGFRYDFDVQTFVAPYITGNLSGSTGLPLTTGVTGILPIANGGTNATATPTSGAVAYGTGTGYAFTSAGIAGQYLASTGATSPAWSTVSSAAGSDGYYGVYYDKTTQTIASTTTAYLVKFSDHDGQNGVSITSNTDIAVAYAGVYNLQFSLQFKNTDSQDHEAYVWFRLNGSDIADSRSDFTVPSKHGSFDGSLIGALNFVLAMNPGDYVQLVWAAESTAVSLTYAPAGTTPTSPTAPSAIFTIISNPQVGLGYAGLTSATSLLIGTGSKSFTTNFSSLNTAFTVGTRVRLAYTVTPANYMEGVITAYSGTSMTVNVDAVGGSGTYASWNISVAGVAGSGSSVPGTSGQVLISDGAGAFGTPFSLGTGVQTFLTTPSSANLASAVTDETGTGGLVFANTPTLVTPILGTPTSGTLTNCTGLPISTGVSGLGANIATFLATPSASNLAAAVTDETGTGSLVFANTPTLVTPVLGTPTSGTLTNCTGLPISTGVSGLGANVATFLATPSSANLAAAVTDETGSGALVFGTSPTIETPTITTSAVIPIVNGGTNASSTLILQSTSGAGTSDAIIFRTASQSERMRITTNGRVAIGTASPATSAALEVSSTTGALLVPRMTTGQRNGLTAVNGMIIYNTTTNTMQGYINGAWANM